MLRHPYLASALARLSILKVDGAWCTTMATDGFNIFVHPPFVEETTEEHLIGVLAHEVLHVVLGHIDRRQKRDREAWNIAIDHATNLMLVALGFSLPGRPYYDPKYQGMTAEDIYDSLYGGSAKANPGRRLKASRKRKALSNSKQQSNPGGFDVHLEPDDLHGAWARSQGFPSLAERRRLRAIWASDLKSALPGRVAGDLTEEIEKAGAAEINWPAVLQRFVSGLRRDDYRLFPPNKRHIWRGILLPSLGTPGPSHIVAAIDTSGSMDRKLLGAVLAELDGVRSISQAALTLIECDAEIKAVSTYEPWDVPHLDFSRRKFRGRGGTDFRPPFEWVRRCPDQGLPPADALIYLTDGFGPFPEQPPFHPTLWVMFSNAVAPSFGTVLRMQGLAH